MTEDTGGIDLTADKMNVEVKKQIDEGIQFNFDPAILAQLQNVAGFVPVIINIQPMNNLWKFLGLEIIPSPKLN